MLKFLGWLTLFKHTVMATAKEVIWLLWLASLLQLSGNSYQIAFYVPQRSMSVPLSMSEQAESPT